MELSPYKIGYLFLFLGSNISSTERFQYSYRKDLDFYWLTIIWKYDLSDKRKRDFFQAMYVSVLVLDCTTYFIKMLGEKLDENNKNAACYFEQILVATPQEAAFAKPLTFYLSNHPSKMNKIC